MADGLFERGSSAVIVGLGSPIMCDDAVGLRVSQAIEDMGLPDIDCCQEAVGGLDILPVIHGYRYAVIVDAIQTGNYEPGTVMLMFEEDFAEVVGDAPGHDVNLPTALKIGRKMDNSIMPEKIGFVAIEVQDIRTMTETMTQEVEEAVAPATDAVLHMLNSFRN